MDKQNLELLFGLAAIAAFFGLFIAIWVVNARRLAKLRSQDYQWYERTYPDRVINGRVTCHQCGGGHIGTERLLNRTFLRRHFCRRCGTTLYYSPEN